MPVVVELKVQRIDYGARLYALENATMGGPTASAVFGPTVAQADVYWRLQAATGRGCWLPDDAAEDWGNTALAGSLIAFNALVDETVARAPQITAIRGAIDMVVNPNLALEVRKDGARLRHDTGGGNQRKLASEELEQGLAPGRGKPEPSVGVGLDWNLRDEDASDDAPLLEYGAWLATSNVGISNLRTEVDLIRGSWSVTARQRVYDGVFFVATARSEDRTFDLGTWSGGLSWTLPGIPGWTLKLERKQAFDLAEIAQWTITLRGERKTVVPRGVLF